MKVRESPFPVSLLASPFLVSNISLPFGLPSKEAKGLWEQILSVTPEKNEWWAKRINSTFMVKRQRHLDGNKGAPTNVAAPILQSWQVAPSRPAGAASGHTRQGTRLLHACHAQDGAQ